MLGSARRMLISRIFRAPEHDAARLCRISSLGNMSDEVGYLRGLDKGFANELDGLTQTVAPLADGFGHRAVPVPVLPMGV